MSITSLISRFSPGATTADLDAESSVVTDEADAWDVLRNRRRRQVIAEAASTDTDDTLTTREIAEQIAAYEAGKPVSELSSSEYKRAYIPLYQDHLPKLDNAGYIDFDQARNTITATEKTEAAVGLLVAADSNDVFQGGDSA